MVKTTKGGKTMNPTSAYRKELRKKELKRVPASVRVRRESALPKPKPKTSTISTSNRPTVAPPVAKQESTGSSSAPKSINDSCIAFLARGHESTRFS